MRATHFLRLLFAIWLAVCLAPRFGERLAIALGDDGDSGSGKTGKKSKQSGEEADDGEGADDGESDDEGGEVVEDDGGIILRLPVKRGKPKPPPPSNREIPAGLSEKAEKQLRDAIKAYKEAFEGDSKKRDKLFKSAVRKLESAAKSADLSSLALPHFYVGSAYNQVKNPALAEPSLEKAVAINDRFHEAHLLLAEVYNLQGKSTKALESYDKALALYPGWGRALKGKADVLVKLGKLKEAMNFARKAYIELGDPKHELFAYLYYLAIEIRLELQGTGWKKEYVAETENYRVLTSVSQEYAEEIGKHAELIRRTYAKIFPNIPRPERKYQILVHKNKAAYHQAGGPQGAGGHYSPLLRKLVFYKYPKEDDTLIVLYHEAFHQYLHEYLEIAPQWFNEGLGDYFAPYRYERRGPQEEVMKSHANPWRLKLIKEAIRQRMTPEPSVLMMMSREEMYDPEMAGIHYAMAWSLIYFMLEEGTYRQNLVRYFQALRKGRGIDGAYEDAFAREDMARFEERWKTFIMKIDERGR